MARTRKTASKARAKRASKTISQTGAKRASTTSSTASTTQGGGEFKCPECGKTFARAAALGSHRRRAHGVVGASAEAGSTSRSRARSSSSSRSVRSTGRVDRDALLQTLFPTGVPAKEDVIRSLNGWLDEAERLAALR
jgi:predicted RNA-binding Zn-ribbon protein involved in translation (DUF1610 family)